MPRYRLLLEYDGAPFRGWQRQENGPSVQEAVEEAAFAFAGERTTVEGAGRTDTGVHALGQAAHLDLATAREPRRVRMGLNFHLARIVRGRVSVLDCVEAAPDFHARFSATGRRYLYRILNRPSPPAIGRGRVWWIPQALDAAAMAEAARALEGRHDFTSFRAAGCQARSPLRTLDSLTVERHGDGITVRADARSFLHRQVRNMVGTLAEVGRGRRGPDFPRRALAARDRAAAGPVAPAHGLYLEAVLYGDRESARR